MKPSYVYIMRLSWWRVKIGYSNAPTLRAKQVDKDVDVLYVACLFPCRNERKAQSLEKWLHDWFGLLRWWGRTERFFMPPYTWVVVLPLVLLWRLSVGWWK